MIELIHLHIPKTGGRSFFRILKSVYGDAVDGPRNRGKLFLNNPKPVPLIGIIPENKRILYGHLEYKHVRDIVLRDNPKIITWLRDPVERVISHYYFQMKKYVENPEKHNGQYINQQSLMEFARDDKFINVMSHFLEGLNPEELFFIGTLENYEIDLEILSKKLNWKKYKRSVHQNDNKKFRDNPICKTKIVTKEMREEITNLNREDVSLYNKALDLRKKHIRKGIHFSLHRIFYPKA